MGNREAIHGIFFFFHDPALCGQGMKMQVIGEFRIRGLELQMQDFYQGRRCIQMQIVFSAI